MEKDKEMEKSIINMYDELINQMNNIYGNNLISRGIFIHTTSIYQTTLGLYSFLKKNNISVNTLPVDDLINRPVTQLINIDVLNHKPTSSINSFFNYKTSVNNEMKCLLINNIDLYVFFKNYHIILKNLIDVLSPKHSPLLTIPVIFISNSNTTNELANYCKNIKINIDLNNELIRNDTHINNKSLSDFNKLLYFITLKKSSNISIEDCLLNNISIIIKWYVSKCNSNSNNSNNSNNNSNYINEYLNYLKRINISTDKILTFEYIIDQLQNKYKNQLDNDNNNNDNIEQIFHILIIQTNETNAQIVSIKNTEICLLEICNILQINKLSAIQIIKSLHKNNKLFDEYVDKLKMAKNTLRMLVKQFKD